MLAFQSQLDLLLLRLHNFTSLQTIPENKGLIDESLIWMLLFFLSQEFNLARLFLFIKDDNVFSKHKCVMIKSKPRGQLMNLKLRNIFLFSVH